MRNFRFDFRHRIIVHPAASACGSNPR